MFESTSRYSSIEDASIKTDDRTIVYKKRRFLPNGSEMPLLHEVMIVTGDRIDTISARILGDPEQFWRICDANNTMHPLELTSEPGSLIRIARLWG